MLAAAGQPWLLALVPVAIIGASHAVCCQGLLRGQSCVIGLRLRNNQLWAHHNNGPLIAVHPGSGSRIGAVFSALQLRQTDNNSYHSTVLLLGGDHGNLQADDARRLRLWLRLGQKPLPGVQAL